MQSGSLNQRVNIEQRTTTQDAAGQPVETWSLVAAVWADIRHASGLQTIKADADTSLIKTSIRIRYRTGIDAGMRVAHGSTNYDIRAVLPDIAGKRFLDLVCQVAA